MADDSNNMDFNTIIWELQRIEDLQQKQEEIQEELSETTEEVEEVKVSTEDVEKLIGIKESDKKKNVIDGDKLSTTLTTSEKKRYENIGKEFIAGAGKELENVRKAVQFKDAMSVVKNKFSEGVIKFKEGLKKAQKAGSFFGKLMIIIGLLGTIVMLFKDKIASVFPNLGETIKDMFEGFKNGVGGILNGLLEFLKEKITHLGTTMLGDVFSKAIMSFVGSFFTQTLPEAIITLYVGILSSFSSSAMEMYNQRIEGHASDTFSGYVSQAEGEIKNGTPPNSQSQPVNGTNGNYLANANAAWGRVLNSGPLDSRNNANISDLTTSLYATTAREMTKNENVRLLEYLQALVEGDYNLRQLINSGDFDTTRFLNEIKSKQDDGKLTRREVFDAMRNSISDAVLERGFNPRRIVNENGDVEIAGDITTLMTAISNASENQQTEIQNIINVRREDERRRIEQAQNRFNEYRRTLTTIEAGNVITEVLEESLTSLVDSITYFLSGDKIADELKSSFQELNGSFTVFFNEFNTFLKGAFDNLGDNIVALVNFYNENGRNIISQVESIKNDILQTYMGMVYDIKLAIKEEFDNLRSNGSISSLITPSTEISPNPNSFNDVNFNAIVNVQLPQSDANVGYLIAEVVSVDEQLVSFMQDSNKNMDKVIESFSKIYNLHAASKDYVDNKCSTLEDQITTKLNELSAGLSNLPNNRDNGNVTSTVANVYLQRPLPVTLLA